MRPKSFILLALALGCGAIASVGISQVMEKNRHNGQGNVETEAIYVAKHNINVGDSIKAEMVNLEEWPKDRIPQGAIRELTELEDRRPRSLIVAGEPMLEAKLIAAGESLDPSTEIPKDHRVIPISVKVHEGGAGLIHPGDRVDVQWYAQVNKNAGIQKPFTRTILQNIRIFAIDQSHNRRAEGEEGPQIAKTISVVVTPKQANMIRLAEKNGEISLVLRNPDSEVTEEAEDVNLQTLLGKSDSNTREQEQRSENDSNGASATDPLLAAIAKSQGEAEGDYSTPAKAPFIMEIIFPNENVVYKPFDSDTGRPLDTNPTQPTMGGTYSDAFSQMPNDTDPSMGAPMPGANPGTVPLGGEEFPIDLGGLTNPGKVKAKSKKK